MHYNFCSLEIQLDWVLVLITELYMLLHPPCMCPTTWYYGMSVRAGGTGGTREAIPPIYLHLIFAILQFETSSLRNWIFLPAVACKIQVWNILKIKFIKLDSLENCKNWVQIDREIDTPPPNFWPWLSLKPNLSINNFQLVRLLQDSPIKSLFSEATPSPIQFFEN